MGEIGHAQRTATSVVTNFNTAGSAFSFEVWSRKTNPGTGPDDTIRVGTSSFYFDYNSSALSTPTLSSINAKYTGDSTTSSDYAPMRVEIVAGKIAVTVFYTGFQTGLGGLLSSALPNGERICTVNMQIIDGGQPTNVQWDSVNSASTHSGEQPVENTFDSVAVATVRASVRVFLQGPYVAAGDSMSNALRTGGHLAAHFGSVPIPAFAVDSINIEMRDSASAAASTLQKFAPAWLMTDGTIRSFNDTTLNYVQLEGAEGNYYLVVRHRNHLAIMCSTSQALDSEGIPSAYDFSTGQNMAFGTNAMIAIGSRFAMFGGNVDENAGVGATDLANIRSGLGATGYNINDVDMNSGVGATDLVLSRSSLGQVTQVP